MTTLRTLKGEDVLEEVEEPAGEEKGQGPHPVQFLKLPKREYVLIKMCDLCSGKITQIIQKPESGLNAML